MTVEAQHIISYLESSTDRPVSVRELAEGLGIRRAERRSFQRLLRELVEAGQVYRLRGRRYALPDRLRLVVGRFRRSRRGGGVVTPEGGIDLHIRAGDAGSAVDGDVVVARPEGRGRRGRPEGRVIRILERGRRTVVGRYHQGRHGRERRMTGAGWVVPEDPAVARDVLVADSEATAHGPGDVVVVRVTDWGDTHRGPVGVIERVLGPADAPGVDVLAVLHGHELPADFSPEAEAEAERLRERGISPDDVQGRLDYRDRLVFTIDPSDAKDHDDALSVRGGAQGRMEVGVHIADVAFHVAEGGAMDVEARERATSVYLVDRAIPMLPAAVSSDLGSLLPDRDRLAISVLFDVDADGAVGSARIERSLIRSRYRLTYDEAQDVLAGEARIEPELDAALDRLGGFARVLRARRMARGSLDFDLPEPRVLLDAAGRPVAVMREPRHESHRLVEDLMLLANETVGGRAKRLGQPFLFRVHEPPDETKLTELAETARALGYTAPRGRLTPARLQALLGQTGGDAAGQLFSMLVLRSMKPAHYSERDVGHFGLATDGYTHFTSPIRRYPDLVVHRLVLGSLAARPAARATLAPDQLAAIARHASERERVAQSAERDSVNLKKVRFMGDHVGGVFDGTISDLRPFGFFVLLDDHYIEGLVHVSALGDDYYRWREDRYLLVGERTGRRFTIGQRVRVQVAAVDVERRRIDFVPVHDDARPERRSNASKRRTKRRRD